MEFLEPRLLLSTFTVVNTNDSGAGSLRAAIGSANFSPDLDLIAFNIPGSALIIQPVTALPGITSPVVIDGTTQPGFAGTPIIELNGTNPSITYTFSGLRISAGGSTVRGLAINGFRESGIRLEANGGNVIAGNYLGTDVTGTVDLGNAHSGVYIVSGSGNIIGGATVADRNLVSGNNFGIDIRGNNTLVQGNYIGTNAAGDAALGNTNQGILISPGISNNTIGGTTSGARNLISANGADGIMINGSAGNLVQGNYIGTNFAGIRDLGNTGDGIVVLGVGATNNTIGGTADGAGNLISGNNGAGIALGSGYSGSYGNLVQGNYIGTDVTGTRELGNTGNGIEILLSNNNTIGGASTAARNVISGNATYGIYIAGAENNRVQGNYIGVDVTGAAALGNTNDGVRIASGNNNTVGGTEAGAGNVITGNSGGIYVATSTAGPGSRIQGNFIGTDRTGASLVPHPGNDGQLGTGDDSQGNRNYGVQIGGAGSNTIIGGTTVADRNVISGNGGDGVILATGATTTLVQGNIIGADVSGTLDLGNKLYGVLVKGVVVQGYDNTIGGTAPGAGNLIAGNDGGGVWLVPGGKPTRIEGNQILRNSGYGVNVNSYGPNTIGGTAGGAGNTIAFNSGDGVRLWSGARHSILSNSIYANGGLGIHLGSYSGPTPNDPGDADTGPNLRQNYPVLTTVTGDGTSTTIQGTLNSTANASFTLQFFANAAADPSGYGEGETFLGSQTVTTDSAGNASFTVTLPVAIPAGHFVSATATDSNGNSSEFSGNRVVQSSNQAPLAVPDAFAATEDTTLDIAAPGVLSNDTDPNGNPITAVLVGAPAHGSVVLRADGSFSYTPSADFNGADSFTYKANDGQADSNVATVTLTVGPVNDAPLANNDAATTNEDNSVTISVLANDRPGPATAVDEAGQTLTVVLAGPAGHGTVTINADNTITYTPDANYNGPDSFSYTIRDSGVPPLDASASGVVTINPVNDAPVASDNSYTTNEDTALEVRSPGVLAGDTDVDGDLLYATLVQAPTHGGLSLNAEGSFVYTPAGDFNGSDSFTYKANDNAADSNAATVTITVNPVNDAPVAADQAVSTDEDTAFSGAVSGSDVDADALAFAIVAGPARGVAAMTADGSFTYTSFADFNGIDSFSYKANDGQADSNVATVTIIVNPVNDAPVVADQAVNTDEDTPFSGVVSGSDVDADTLTFAVATGPAHGVVTMNTDGSFSYTPAADFSGTDSFTYRANDGVADSNVATVSVTVIPSAALSGMVWVDFNDDGLVDFREKGIPGVTVVLDGFDDLGRSVSRALQTDSDGAYNFLDLRPGSYQLAEVTDAALADFLDGSDAVGTAGGTLLNDLITDIALDPGQTGVNYNFGERPAPGAAVVQGQSAGVGFWQNRNGQALIRSFDGGAEATNLGLWLAATLPNIFGAAAAANNLTGKSNAEVAAAYQQRFLVKGLKLDAQLMATALSVYATSSSLGGAWAGAYGFSVSEYGLGNSTYNVGSNGAAFNVADNTVLTVMDILLKANEQAVSGTLYNGNATLRKLANNVFGGINALGSIG